MGKHLVWAWTALLGMALLGFLAGCPTPADDDASDDDDTGDDDTADDDTGDDDMDDDDSGDDDTWPAQPSGFSIDVSFNANDGVSTTTFIHTMNDANYNPLCAIDFEFTGTVATGPGQGNDYYQYIDEVIEWTGGGETANNCPAQWAVVKGNVIEWFMWYMHPLAFVSCDLVGDVPALGTTFLGDDPSESGDGTFADYCDVTGPTIASANGTGPIEGLWLSPGTQGALDGLGNYAYFAPDDTTNVAVWMLMGLLMADAANTNEPVAGLDGDYVTVPFWLWIYST